MKQALWFLCKPALAMLGTLAAVYGGLLVLTALFGYNSLFGTYLVGYGMVFYIIAAVCAAQATGSYCHLALGFGVTRRTLQRAVVLYCLVLCGVTQIFNAAVGAVTQHLLLVWDKPQVMYLLSGQPLYGLGLMLLFCGAMLWGGTVDFSTASIPKRVLLIAGMILLYGQMAVFMLINQFLGDGIFRAYCAVLAVLGLGFTALAAHRLRHLAVNQA